MQEAKLYVGNLSFSCTEDQLKELFSPFGSVVEAIIIKNKFNNRSKGFGFVEMEKEEDVQNAIDNLNDTQHLERTIKVAKAQPKVDSDKS